MIMPAIVIVSFVLVMFVASACSGEKYGAGYDLSAPLVKVKDVMFRQELVNKRVSLQGNIVSQCQSNGCWFFLQDDTGQIFIDLAKNNFALPTRIGRQAKVSGTVVTVGHGNIIVATGVEVI